jgi:DNA-binding response OmpR family regulator
MAQGIVGGFPREQPTSGHAVGPIDVLFLASDGAAIGAARHQPGSRVVSDGTLFRRLLHRSRPALVVCFAPPATTLDLEAVVAHRRRRGEMRALFVNAPSLIEERLQMLRAGFDEALPASIDALELTGRLALMTDRANQQVAETRLIISPEVVLDVAARELRVRGRRIHLRPRECQLLAVLGREPGRTFSREQLLTAVGAASTVRDARTIDVHIRWLREKLDVGEGQPARLITARGVGYRLEIGDRR